MVFSYFKKPLVLMILAFMVSCAVVVKKQLDEDYGLPKVQDRLVAHDSEQGAYFTQRVQPLLNKRCVVCHACYDAPCQLKLSSGEGIDRGASEAKVYDSARIKEAPLTRLFMDAHDTASWRKKGFFPVLNERENSLEANQKGSVLYQMLALKQKHPLPKVKQLSGDFDFSTDRAQECPAIEEFDQFARQKPLWGMPYGLPGLTDKEFQTLNHWIQQGSPLPERKPLVKSYKQRIAEWEAFLIKAR